MSKNNVGGFYLRTIFAVAYVSVVLPFTAKLLGI